MTTPPFDRYADDYDRLLDDPLRDRFASSGDFFIQQKCRVLMRDLERRLPRSKPLRMLDAGCGDGTAIAFLADRARAFGTDVSLPMLRRAVGHAPVAVQEPFALPFADATFDAVFAFCVYHHIETADRATHLRELARVVAPGGIVSVFEHNPFNPVTRRIFERAPIDRGCMMIAPTELRGLFRGIGLDDVELGYCLFLPERLWSWIGFVERALEWLPLGGQYFVSGRRV